MRPGPYWARVTSMSASPVAAVREALQQKDFDTVWAEGAVLSTEEAIAYAERGRGERKRPTTGWTPRTVQTHHVYTKLGLTSRALLMQEAARRTWATRRKVVRRKSPSQPDTPVVEQIRQMVLTKIGAKMLFSQSIGKLLPCT